MVSRSEATPYDITNRAAGQQCSSTSEGRYVNIIEDNLTHPLHSDPNDLVQKGDPCCVYELVGIAMNTALSTSDVVVLDTEGVWWLDVTCSFFGADISVGQRVYIDTAGIVSDDITGMPFGWALGPVTDGQTELIAVKVHSTEWLFWVFYWFWGQQP